MKPYSEMTYAHLMNEPLVIQPADKKEPDPEEEPETTKKQPTQYAPLEEPIKPPQYKSNALRRLLKQKGRK